MVTAEIIFAVGHDADVEAVESLIAAWFKNGQLADHWQTVRTPGLVRVFASISGAEALTDTHNNQYVTEGLAALTLRGIEPPEVRIIGVDPHAPEACGCDRRSCLIMFTQYLSNTSPVRCGDCFGLVPVYVLPHTHDHEHLDILQWAADYCAFDTLQMHCTNGERWAERQLAAHDGSLAKQGRKIASQLSALTAVPVYYFLLKARGVSTAAERRRVCPACRGVWLLDEPWHRQFDFKCESCHLVSNIAYSLRG